LFLVRVGKDTGRLYRQPSLLRPLLLDCLCFSPLSYSDPAWSIGQFMDAAQNPYLGEHPTQSEGRGAVPDDCMLWSTKRKSACTLYGQADRSTLPPTGMPASKHTPHPPRGSWHSILESSLKQRPIVPTSPPSERRFQSWFPPKNARSDCSYNFYALLGAEINPDIFILFLISPRNKPLYKPAVAEPKADRSRAK